MSSEPSITLYDITSKLNPPAWSPNTFKARMVLNYKHIPYNAVWLSYPDIEGTLTKLGCASTTTKPNNPSKAHYTLPAIVDTSSSPPVVIADSLAIAEYLDAKYPDRPVFPKQGKALQYAFEECFKSLVGTRFHVIMIPAVHAILDDHGSAYFRQTRETWFGKKLEAFNPEGPVREAHWRALENGFDQLAAIIEKNGAGVDYVAGGSELTRADIILISYLRWIKVVSPDEWEKRVRHWSGGRWDTLLKITAEWQAVF